jgi:methionyl-tRNA formyltransferase
VKTVFFGTPEIAVPALEALLETTTVVSVVSQPDRPAGRKLKPQPSAVKRAAERLGLPIHQPSRVKTGLAQWLREQDADLGVVLAYGRILPGDVLAAPRHGCVNLHASLLPKYRGAAPIARVLQHGETETGVSLMRMDEGLDTGPVYVQRRLAIDEGWDHGDLSRAMGQLCAKIVHQDLDLALSTEPEPQDGTLATLAPPIRAEETQLDWSRPAVELWRDVRAFGPEPGAHTFRRGRRVRVLRARVAPEWEATLDATAPGTVVVCRKATLLVATGAGVLAIERAQVEGKKPLAARELINGRAFELGDTLG